MSDQDNNQKTGGISVEEVKPKLKKPKLYRVILMNDDYTIPDKWLDKDVWPVPTLVDDKDSSAGKAFGLTSFPTWIILDSEGKVINRFSGSITTKDFINLTDFLLKEESIEK